MNKNAYIISGILVLILIAAGYAAFGKKQVSVETTVPAKTTTGDAVANFGVAEGTPSSTGSKQIMKKAAVTVTYTDSGFSPASVSVKVGDTVEWLNQGTKQMWVASAPHPQHTDYPGFDQLASTGKGTTYSFTFTKAGTWKYHNHVNVKDFGSVVVK